MEELYFTTREINSLIIYASNALGLAISYLKSAERKRDYKEIESWLNEAKRINTILQKLKQWKEQGEQV